MSANVEQAVELSRASGGHRRGERVSIWSGWSCVGKTKPSAGRAASMTKRYQMFQLDVVTRWGSTVTMLQSFLYVAPSLFDAMQQHTALFEKYDKQLPTIDDIRVAKAIIKVLAPFENATKLLGGEEYASLALVPEVVDQLFYVLKQTHDDNTLAVELRLTMLEAFKFKFEPLFREPNLATMAAFVHPEKGTGIVSGAYVAKEVVNKIQNCLVDEMVSIRPSGWVAIQDRP